MHLALKNWQVVIGNLQNDAGHAGAIFHANRIGPRSILSLPGNQRVAHRRIPLGPILAAGLPHGLYRVVVAVEIMAFAIELVGLGHEPHYIFESLLDLWPFVDSRAV